MSHASHGYIVYHAYTSAPCVLLVRDNGMWRGVPAGGILCCGNKEVTRFMTRKEAREAVARSMTYFQARTPNEPMTADSYEVVRLIGEF